MKTGTDRFIVDFKKRFSPYPKQRAFMASPAPYRFLGGAAGPGKTACLIVDHMMECQQFNADDAPHVHTVLFRRTHPQLEATLITRFNELIPKELYKAFNRTKNEVLWLNGSTTKFGSMQHEDDVWGWQGQWLKIGYDELCDFTFRQWSSISPWNRCPVSKWTTKDGAGNPTGIGAGWVRRLFVDHITCDEMDKDQKAFYRAEDYAFFPCTYLDNPKYANDPNFLANLMSLPAAKREAFMNGSWDVVGGYFEGAFDSAENVDETNPQPLRWHRRWISGDWGMAHNSAIYWHYLDDHGVFHTYQELVINRLDPEELAEQIIKLSVDPDGKTPRFEWFAFSHDAFAEKTNKGQSHTIAGQMAPFLQKAGLPPPFNAGKDQKGRETTMYNLLRRRIPAGVRADGMPRMVPNWIINESCARLIECLGTAPRDNKDMEKIASYLGDDPLQGAGYGVYHVFGQPAEKPVTVVKQELWAAQPERSVHSKVMEQRVFDAQHRPVKPGRGRTTWAR